MKFAGRRSVGSQPSSRRPTGFEGVPVTLRGTFCIAFFKLLFSVDSKGRPKDYMTEDSGQLGNFQIMKNLILFQRIKHLQILELVIFNKCCNFRTSDTTEVKEGYMESPLTKESKYVCLTSVVCLV